MREETAGGGVIATERSGLGIARITARRGQGARMAQVLRDSLGVEPPKGSRRAAHGDVAIAGVGPETWLATRDEAGNAFAESLLALLGDSASISDQTDAYVILRIAGPKVRDMLAKLTPIDVHSRSFHVGDVAQTLCGYVNVTLWRLEDTPQHEPVFEIWAARSLAASFHQAIGHAAAEFGLVRQAP
jgi:sarcosine oxidase subunit gamma